MNLSVPEGKPTDKAKNEQLCWSADEDFPLLQPNLGEDAIGHLQGRGGSGELLFYDGLLGIRRGTDINRIRVILSNMCFRNFKLCISQYLV